MISFRQKGDFSKLTKYFEKVQKTNNLGIFDKYGKEGVAALASATPIDSGETSNMWSYDVENQNGSIVITFNNDHINKGVPIAIVLQYGHGTGTGGWIEGRDYINPAIQPIFDRLTEEAWKEVTKL